MDTLTCLQEARALIADPARWTKGTSSKINEDGSESYCMLGAIGHIQDQLVAAGEDIGTLWMDASDAIYAVLPPYLGIAMFNDDNETTHAMVLELLDRAIAKLQPEGT